MHTKFTAILSVILSSSLAATVATHGSSQAAAAQSPSAQERDRLLAKGKELFVARCASCHGENGSKPLKTGAPLRDRGLPTAKIAQAVKGRLSDNTEEERSAVTLYIASLMKKSDSQEKPR